MNAKRWGGGATALMTMVVSGMDASAQQADVEARGRVLEEIVVTARRREESIQDVPISVTALSGAALASARVTDITGLTTQAPSLVIVPGNGANRNTPVFSLRGLSQQELTILADPSVTTYFGDIVYARAQGLNAALFDIERVEVLKGPQGTLFGRNVTGGAIVVKPMRPTEEFGASIALTIGNFDTREAEVMLNSPIGERAQVRIAGALRQDDGYVEDVLTGHNLDDTDTQALRVSLAVQPTDSIDSLFVFNAVREDDGVSGTFVNAINMATNPETGAFVSVLCGAGPSFLGWGSCTQLAADQAARGIYETASNFPQFTDTDTWDLTNTTTWDITDALTFKSILGYRTIDNHTAVDTDGTPWPVLSIERIDDLSQESAELQLLGQRDTFNWIVGAYYFHEYGENHGISITARPEPAPGSGTNLGPEPLPYGFSSWSDTNVEGNNLSYALFAQGTMELDRVLDGLSLTAGVRYTWDEKRTVIKNHVGTTGGVPTACRFTVDDDDNPATPEVNPGIGGCRLPLEADFSEPTWTLSLEYRATDAALLYLAHRHGYRSGGFGARASTEAGLRRTFEPETVDDIELGMKVDWLPGGMPLRTNLAVYYSDYQDIQRLLTDPNTVPVTTVTTNAGKAEITGAELELTFQPTENLTLSGWYAYTDAEFTEFIAPDGTDLSQNPFARAPEHLGSASVRYEVPLAAAGTLAFGASYWFTDDYSSNDDFNPTVMIDGYDLVNLTLDWNRVMGSNFDVGLFCNNATDEEYALAMLNIYSSLGFDARTAGEPRTYGARLTYRFGD